jgi:ABC-2 type transport system permease protein
MRALLKKNIAESRLLFLACAAALFGFCWLYVWLVGRFSMSRFQTVLEQFREYERLMPVPFDQLFTYPGRIAVAYTEPVVFVCMTIWAISRGSDSVSGELGRGTLEMMLAQPVSRLKLLASHIMVTVTGVALLAAAAWAGTCTGIAMTTVKEEIAPPSIKLPMGFELPLTTGEPQTVRTPMSELVTGSDFLPAAVNLFALGFFLAGLATLLSSADRYRWRTIGLAVGLFVIQFVMKIVGKASDSWSWLLRCTWFRAYEPASFVTLTVRSPEHAWSLILRDSRGQFLDFGPLGYDLVLISLGCAAFVCAAIIFSRRDLPAPL